MFGYRGRFGIIAGLKRAFAGAPDRPAEPVPERVSGRNAHIDLKGAYVRHVETVQSQMSHEEAMSVAVGGGFEVIGAIESGLLRHYGLPQDGYVIDVGCGSGRLAKPLSAWFTGAYLGTDLVPQLLEHAKKLVGRPDWRFEQVEHIGIPEEDGRADMVVFFSVLTHLLHEQGYWYLQEARRVLKPGGKIVFSFLEFREPAHWYVFEDTLAASKAGLFTHLNVFIERDVIPVWAEHLGLIVEDIRAGGDAVAPEGSLGQALCVLRKPG